MKIRTFIVTALCLIIAVWVYFWLQHRRDGWHTASITNVIIAKPINSPPLYLVQYTHPDGNGETVMSSLPGSNIFNFKRMGNNILIHLP